MQQAVWAVTVSRWTGGTPGTFSSDMTCSNIVVGFQPPLSIEILPGPRARFEYWHERMLDGVGTVPTAKVATAAAARTTRQH
jgi:hypothetical protein